MVDSRALGARLTVGGDADAGLEGPTSFTPEMGGSVAISGSGFLALPPVIPTDDATMVVPEL